MFRLVLFILAGAVMLTACATATATDDDLLVLGLCDAIDASTPSEAGNIFARRAHGPLHEMTASLTEVDPDLAAEILRVKHVVEDTLREGPDDLVRPRLQELLGSARRGLERVGLPAPACP